MWCSNHTNIINMTSKSLNELRMVVNALENGEIDKETAIDLIEMQFECVMIIGIPQKRVYNSHYYPKAMYLAEEPCEHGYHKDMHSLTVSNIADLCNGKILRA